MGTVTKTELNQQTARVLARVAAGEHITVTERGRAIAEISPPRQSAWDRLVAEGKVRPATASGPLDFEPIDLGMTSEEIIEDIRGERW
ncbi:type II toxin-antitoxin system Phd/YefM family antitoxin [Microbacterium azadirachtae]|uniref:Prevent-host-death family protein n=1 Tax=Microbacterium azadirachtae TaxID=582680 RepID=A0A1I6HWF4_9MICO|nr:type II toxin-antitoxin system prevent-host-death family antitoxin [Microbacterium azadirachtae]SFR58764.1 prevent-host-death family protein [Microbacterium azadirachtae]